MQGGRIISVIVISPSAIIRLFFPGVNLKVSQWWALWKAMLIILARVAEIYK